MPDGDSMTLYQASVESSNVGGRKAVRLAVVILTYGAGKETTSLLGDLRVDAIAAAKELIIVHNPSRIGERLEVPTPDEARIVELSTNRGYSGGMNAGIELALRRDPNFVLLLTHDVRISAGDVESLLALMLDQDDFGAIGPTLCEPDGAPYSAGFVLSNRVRMQHRVPKEGAPRPLWSADAIDGSAMLWRAEALRAVGGFDDRFFMYFEDVDICSRARRCGWQVAIATTVQITSAPGKGSRRTAHAYLKARNGLGYARRLGLRGLIAGLAECAIGLWRETPKPGGERIRDPEARRLAIKYWRGTSAGVLDYFRGRWGPPPDRVLRDSDIAGTSTSPSDARPALDDR
jgi:N-acetylglucosaminyl-diphospho-decaprenol L-rhamnosyltransferase